MECLRSSISGKDQDVGEVLVKTLQNTKYSLDAKLENTFISIFTKKVNCLSEAPTDQEDAQKSMDHIKDVQPAEHYQSGEPETDDSAEESDAEELDGSEISDEHKTYQGDLKMKTMDNDSDEDNSNVLEEHFPREKGLKENIEFHDGRMRRKAFFGDEFGQDNLMVICSYLCLFGDCLPMEGGKSEYLFCLSSLL